MTWLERHASRALLVSWLASGTAAGAACSDSNGPPGQACGTCDAAVLPPDSTVPYDAGRGADAHVPADAGGLDSGPAVETPSEPLAGCDPARRAQALYQGAEPVEPPPAEAPLTCAISTGRRAPFNTVITVGETGTLLFAPVNSVGVLRSTDNGSTWEGPVNDPPVREQDLWGHPWLWRDPDSGRSFFTAYSSLTGPCDALGSGTDFWYSDDDGQSWTNVPAGIGCGSFDWGKLLSGPARTAASKQALAASGYPNVVYFCAGNPAYILGPNRACYRSLDGGKTFERTKSNALDSSRGQLSWPNAGAIGPDGTFYIAYASSEGLALTVSEDDGDSWSVVNVPDTVFSGDSNSLNFLSSNVTVDSAGNLYAVYVDDRDLLPYLVTSRDRGESWGKPIMVGAPGVQASVCVNVAVREPGYVAINYYGSPQRDPDPGGGNGHQISDGRPYDAYLTVSRDVFADKPLFWSAQFNEPGTPVFDGITLLVSEYLGAPAFGPDGSIWGAFLHETEIGLVGRVTPPPP